MRGIHIFEKPYYREIHPMRGRTMRGLPVQTTKNREMSTLSPLSFLNL